MKLAYLTNQYPMVSHTFVRREIRALEDQGHEVVRFSIRPMESELIDERDKEEATRTRVILREGWAGLVFGLVRAARRHPLAMAEAAALAVKLGWTSDRGLLRHGAYLAEASLLADWLVRAGSEHLHVHFGTNSATVAMLCRQLGGPPFSFTAHGPEEFDKPGLIGLADKIKRASAVMGVSSFGRSQLYRHCSAEEWKKVHVVRCGVDESYLDTEPPPVKKTRRLVCVGRLCEQKGQLLLVDAAAQLREEGIDFELLLVGDGEMRTVLEQRIAAHGIGDSVRITGWARGDEVRQYLESARAMVLPSFAEGLPVVLMEALALSRPVVTTYIAGIPELVDDRCGWVVPAGSVLHLVEALRAVMAATPRKLNAMGQEGRRRVLEFHDARTNAQALLEAVGGGRRLGSDSSSPPGLGRK